MTWRRLETGREVYFNRDELKTRSRALPPRLRKTASGVRYLAPEDPDGGGTWLAVNEKGLTLALLNRWHEQGERLDSQRSRGGLIPSLIDCGTAAEARFSLEGMSLDCFRPFTLVLLGEEDVVMAWDGASLLEEPGECPLTSSSFRFEEVRRARKEAYAGAADDLATFHAGGGSCASAYTVRMNRPDAQTWSRSVIRLGQDIFWTYYEEMPDLEGAPVEHRARLDLA